LVRGISLLRVAAVRVAASGANPPDYDVPSSTQLLDG